MSIRIACVSAPGKNSRMTLALQDSPSLRHHYNSLSYYPFYYQSVTEGLLHMDKSCAEPLPHGFFDVVILNASEASELSSALKLISAISHWLPAAFVLYSPFVDDSAVKKQARQLGVRFGTSEAGDLGRLASAADHVCGIRRQAMTPHMRYLSRPIRFTGHDDLPDLMVKAYQFGRSFTGDGQDFRSWSQPALELTDRAKLWLDREDRPEFIGPLASIHGRAHLCMRLVGPDLWK